MFKYFLKTGLRSLSKNKLYSIINVLGLSIGLAVCLYIFLWIRNEYSYDEFHDNPENIYRVVWDAKFGGNSWEVPLISPPMAATLKDEFPEVDEVTSMLKGNIVFRKGSELIEEENVIYTDPGFFDLFTVEFLHGDPEAPLRGTYSSVITKEFSEKYFGRENSVGEELRASDGRVFKVTGVVKNFPAQSHFHFGILAPINDLEYYRQREFSWGYATVYIYLSLKKGSDINALQEKLNTIVNRGSGSDLDKSGNFQRHYFQPLESIHLHSDLRYELEPNGSILNVYIFGAVAVFILFLAVINFTNLTVVRTRDRLREIGMRKLLGSNKKQLLMQFVSETFIQVMIAAYLAVIMFDQLKGYVNDILGNPVNLELLPETGLVFIYIAVVLLITLISGIYPAVYITSFSPINIIKKESVTHTGQSLFRKVLVTFQFVVAAAIIMGTFVTIDQLSMIQNRDPGFNKENVLVIKNIRKLGKQYTSFRDQLKNTAGVIDATGVQTPPGYIYDSTIFGIEQPADVDRTSLTYSMVDENYVDVLNLEIIEGRNFSKEFGTDANSYLINESAAEFLGWENPVGKKLRYADSDEYEGQIIGVIKDFNFQSFHHEVKPIVFPYLKWLPPYIAVRVQPESFNETIDEIEKTWNNFTPEQPFQFSFLEDDLNEHYSKEQKMTDILMIFAALSIFIAALGLLGTASYIVIQRYKEIAIRKVLGASNAKVWLLVSREFLLLVIIAGLIAAPLAYYTMSQWLQNFAYRVSVSPLSFAAAILLILVTALAATSYQTIKAAGINPVNTLKDE